MTIRLSLRGRLTLFYTVVLIVVLGAFGADVWWVEGRIGQRRVDRDLEGLATTVTSLMAGELREHTTLSAAAAEASRSLASSGRAIAVFDGAGRTVGASWGGLDWHAAAPASPTPWVDTVPGPGGAWRVRVQTQSVGETTFLVLTGNTLRDVERQKHEVLETLWIALPLMAVLAGAAGWWLSTAALRPISAMADQAAQIPTTGVDRLKFDDRADELGTLATAFNGLLARLRGALKTQQQFMADASHELRTPVSVVRAASDIALDQPAREEHEYREALTIIGGQALRLGRLVDSMLVLARADAGGYVLALTDVYLEELVADCCRAVSVLCAKRQVTMRTATWPETRCRGDEELLRQLILNLLQNAVQYTPAGGSVTVDLARHADGVTISVSDTGPGIPDADRGRIFERFVRLDAARNDGGAGLGLPIVRWIAEAHGGRVVLSSSSAAGSTFTVTLPSTAST